MNTDCETLSPKAQEFFKKLEPFFPPDPWKKPCWLAEGIVIDNGRFDLRKHADRKRLEEREKSFIGYLVEMQAETHWKEKGTLAGFLSHAALKSGFAKMIEEHAELLIHLKELDFQIETMDLIEEPA